MGKGKKQRDAELGKYQLMNRVRDEKTGEWLQFMWTEFPVNSVNHRLLNRASRDIDGIAGVTPVDNTDGSTCMIVFDEYVDDAAIPGKLSRFFERLDEHVIDYRQATPADIRDALVVHSEDSPHQSYRHRS